MQRLEDERAARRAPRRRPRPRSAGSAPTSPVRTIVPRGSSAPSPSDDLERDPDARARAVVHRVVDQPRVPAHGGAPARRAEVRLGRDRVLEVAERVGRVGEQLDERHQRRRPRCAPASPARAPPAGRASAAGSWRSPSPGSRSAARAARRPRTRSSVAQSKSLGQSTLNEKSTDESSSSKPGGGLVRPVAACGRAAACRSRSRRSSSRARRAPRSDRRAGRRAPARRRAAGPATRSARARPLDLDAADAHAALDHDVALVERGRAAAGSARAASGARPAPRGSRCR